MKNKEKYFNEILEAFTNRGICEFKITHIHKRENCIGSSCTECTKKVKQWLEEEYKEHIKLAQFEYDLISACCGYGEKLHFGRFRVLMEMKEKGYFKEVNPEMEISEIIKNCEIID